MFVNTIAATIGTVAFAVLFSVPRRYYFFCGIIGGTGWLLYDMMKTCLHMPIVIATFIATVIAVILSRIVAVKERCPATVFSIVGIFPLIPGSGVYETLYYLVTEEVELALASGWNALKASVAIVLGLVIVFELPQQLFKCCLIKKKS